MSVELLAFVIASMDLLQPKVDHAVLGGAIARRVEIERPLFVADEDRKKTAALLVAIAYRESGFRLDAEGDRDASGVARSLCALQVSDGAGGSRALLTDADACVLAGFRVLQWSVRNCSAHPVAMYAAGNVGCTNARAQRISRDRLQLAAWILAKKGSV